MCAHAITASPVCIPSCPSWLLPLQEILAASLLFLPFPSLPFLAVAWLHLSICPFPFPSPSSRFHISRAVRARSMRHAIPSHPIQAIHPSTPSIHPSSPMPIRRFHVHVHVQPCPPQPCSSMSNVPRPCHASPLSSVRHSLCPSAHVSLVCSCFPIRPHPHPSASLPPPVRVPLFPLVRSTLPSPRVLVF